MVADVPSGAASLPIILCNGWSVDEPSIARAPDEYERQYMDADRAVAIARVRQRLELRLALMAFVLSVVVFNLQGLVVIAPWLWALRHEAPLFVGVVFASYAFLALSLLWLPIAELLGAVTRVVLTPTHLRVHRGLATTDVPLSAVTAVAVERTSRWFPALPAFRGLSRRDTVYQSFRTRESVRVEWLDEKGRSRRLWVYLDEAEALRERIEALRGGSTGVRVELADEALETDEREASAGEAPARGRAR